MPVSQRKVASLAKSGSTGLKGDVTLSEGANITLTQSGQNIAIAGSASGGDISGTGVVGQVAEFVTNTKTLQAAKLIGPASNILTITNGAASTLALAITSTKTLTLTSTNDYNLTIPATGTAALLGTANIFTTTQTIQLATDAQELILKAEPGQTANIQEWQNSAGTVMAGIGVNGHMGLGQAPSANYMLTNTFSTSTNTDSQIGTYNSVSFGYYNPTMSNGIYGSYNSAATSPNQANNITGALIGAKGNAVHNGAGTLSQGIGSYYEVVNAGAGIITEAFGFFINGNMNTGAGSITNNFGLYVGNESSGTTINYAIYTNAGNCLFNGGGDASTDFTVKSDTYDALFIDASNNSIDIMHHASGLIGFFAQTPAAQQTYTAVSNPPTQAEVTAIRNALVNLGLMKAS
jgi:hypothetical protein